MAVIPARGGTKRIPRKNIRLFHGKPMISWPIRAALESGLFDEVVVSTDDPEIVAVAVESGATTPFVRPAELADDHTGVVAVVKHAVEWRAAGGTAPDSVCLIYATAPFTSPADLARGLEALERAGADFALSVASFGSPIQRALKVNERGRVEMFHPELYHARSQDLEEAWHDAGQFCWGRAGAWRAGKPIFLSDCAAVPIPRHRVQDIDTIEDWKRAELLFSALRASELADGEKFNDQ
jgi:N-acylneuraminate cytidylyltransferase